MRIALAQMDMAWLDESVNLAKVERCAEQASDADLLVLPEMFTTGFCMDAKDSAISMDGTIVSRLRELSKRYDLAIYGSLAIKDDGRFFNRGLFICPDGTVHHYDKRHLFSPGMEADHYCQGKDRVVVSYKGWRFCLQICYDLRFPVFVRNVDNEYDVLLYVANWAESRISAWNRLLPARAIENMAYVCGVNRVGADIYGEQGGCSVLLDPIGNVIVDCGKGEKLLVSPELDMERLKRMRTKFPVYKDADRFSLE